MAKTAEEIATALMGGLYSLVCHAAGDADGDPTDDPFIAWCLPGIPFDPEDFHFAKFMLKGQGASEDERVADASNQLTQAAGFSRFIDFVPSIDGVVAQNVTGGVMRPGAATLSTIYGRFLDTSQVGKIPEPAGINEQIKKLQEQAAPLQAAYDEHAAAYDAAKIAYVTARLAGSYSPRDAMTFRATGPGLKNRMTRERQAWEVAGSKTRYENLLSEIDALRGKRSPAIWRSEALANYNAMPEGADVTFGEARLTLPYPPSFATNTSGWTSYAVKIDNVDELNKSKSTKWGASGGGGWASFKLSASAEGARTETLAIRDTNGFSLKLSIAQVPLIRNWFDPWFLKSDLWRVDPTSIEGQAGDVVSDGGMPPKGKLIAYPVAALFIRDVEIEMAELHDETSELVKTLKAEGKGGWGFGVINVGGSYQRDSSEKKHKATIANGKLTIEGMQLIGVLCEVMDKPSPNPRQGLAWVEA